MNFKQQCRKYCRRLVWPETSFERTFRKHVTVFSVCWFFVVLPLVSYDKPHSVYYRLFHSNISAERTLTAENDKRTFEASIILSKLGGRLAKPSELPPNESLPNKPRVNIVVVTVSRDRLVKGDLYTPKYLTQITAKFLYMIDNLRTDFPFHIDFSLCNMDPRPNAHEEAVSLGRYAPMYVKPEFPGEWRWHKEERLKEGYTHCLNQTLRRNADYAFIIEDDAVPNTDLFKVLEKMIQSYLREAKREDNYVYYRTPGVSHEQLHNTVFIKFYHPERLLGFLALDIERIPELFAYSTCFSILLLVMYYVFHPRLRRDILDNTKVIFVVLSLIALSACLLLHRYNIIQFHRLLSPHLYYLTPTPSCCTQAVLYPKHSIRPVVNHLHSIKCNQTYSIDHALDWYVSQAGRRAYLVQPNVFNHVGMYSAHKRDKMNAYLVV